MTSFNDHMRAFHHRRDSRGARRALMGASLGGLFTLYAMYTKPSLFAGCGFSFR